MMEREDTHSVIDHSEGKKISVPDDKGIEYRHRTRLKTLPLDPSSSSHHLILVIERAGLRWDEPPGRPISETEIDGIKADLVTAVAILGKEIEVKLR